MKNKLLLLLILLAQTFYAQEITGSWKGELNISGTKLPLIFHIEKDKSGYKSTIDSPLQGVEGIPVDELLLKNNEVTAKINSINAVFKGLFDGKKITGNFNQGDKTNPLTLERFDKNSEKVETAKILKLPENLDQNIKKVDDFLSYLAKNNAEAGEISIFKGGKEIFKRNFGQNNLPDFKKTNQTFQIGSITKTMTAVMIFKLIEKKQLSLDDKLSKFYPQIPKSNEITIGQLLSHTSGLGDFVMGKDEVKWLVNKTDETQILNRIVEQGSLFEPGTKTQYSNSGYYLLTKILEKISKKSFAENLKTQITEPLKLKNFFAAEHNPTNVFTSFEYAGTWKNIKDFDFDNVVGVGDIATTPENLNTIINAIFTDKLVSKNSRLQMMPKDEIFGMGLAIVPFHTKMFCGHSGGTYGTNSLMIYNGEDDLSISYSLNADRIGANNFAIAILSLLYDVDYEYPNVNNEKIPASELQKYVGDYSSKDIPLGLKISVENDNLMAQGTGQPAFPLEYVKENQFKFDQAGVKITFLPATKQLQLVQGGATYFFDRK